MGGNPNPYVPPAQTPAEIKAESDKEAFQNKQAIADDIATRKGRAGYASLVEPGLFIPPTPDPTPGPVVPQPIVAPVRPNPFHVPQSVRPVQGINALADPTRGRKPPNAVDSLYIP